MGRLNNPILDDYFEDDFPYVNNAKVRTSKANNDDESFDLPDIEPTQYIFKDETQEPIIIPDAVSEGDELSEVFKESPYNYAEEEGNDEPVIPEVENLEELALLVDQFNSENADKEDVYEDEYYPSADDYYSSEETLKIKLDLDAVLSKGFDMKASDVDLISGKPVIYSLMDEVVYDDSFGIMDSTDLQRLQQDIVSSVLDADFTEEKELDASYVIRKGKYAGYRTRLSVGREAGNVFMVFRLILNEIPGLDELGIGPHDPLREWLEFSSGLLLMNGPTGQGKSTTLASLVNHIYHTRRDKIITIENPIEYMYPSDCRVGQIVQREVGSDTWSFVNGLKSAMRQHPKIILLGEVRNAEEMNPLLDAAETGHLAISTMHTKSAAESLQRFMKMYEGVDVERNLEILSQTAKGIANQMLLRTTDGKSRFAIREVLKIDRKVRDMIANGDVKGLIEHQINNGITMEHALVNAVLQGKVDYTYARRKANDPYLFDDIYNES